MENLGLAYVFARKSRMRKWHAEQERKMDLKLGSSMETLGLVNVFARKSRMRKWHAK